MLPRSPLAYVHKLWRCHYMFLLQQNHGWCCQTRHKSEQSVDDTLLVSWDWAVYESVRNDKQCATCRHMASNIDPRRLRVRSLLGETSATAATASATPHSRDPQRRVQISMRLCQAFVPGGLIRMEGRPFLLNADSRVHRRHSNTSAIGGDSCTPRASARELMQRSRDHCGCGQAQGDCSSHV